MKKNKFIVILIITIVFVGVFAGCGSFTYDTVGGGISVNNGSGNGSNDVYSNTTLTGTVTLKQFLDSGPKVGFVTIPSKPGYPLIYLFEDGKVYMVCTHSSSDGPRANDLIFDNSTLPTNAIPWSELDKMSDEEMLEYARDHKQLKFVWYGWNTWTKVDEFSTGKYKLHIYTDYTGKSRDYERIEIQYEKGDNYPYGYNSLPDMDRIKTTADKKVINGSIYTGFVDQDGDELYFRTGNNLTIVLDKVGDAGVEVD